MTKVVLAIMIAAFALLILRYNFVRADRRFQHLDRLPMQWSIGGDVTWTAPRRIALLFIPVLALFVLIAAVLSTFFLEPHPGQEGIEVLVVFILSLSLIGAHSLHIWLIGKAVKGLDG